MICSVLDSSRGFVVVVASEIRLTGVAASAGIASGPVYCYQPVELIIPEREAGSVDQELARFAAAQVAAHDELATLRSMTAQKAGDDHAAIFAAHALLINDPLLIDGVRNRVETGLIVERAVRNTVDELTAVLDGLDDELFAARASDIRDIGLRLLRLLLGVQDTSLAGLREPSVIVAQDLTPSDAARLDPELVLGFCTEGGGLTSHTTILARTLGIPAVIGLGEPLRGVDNGQQVIVDGSDGVVIVNPTAETRRTVEALDRRRARWQGRISRLAGEDTFTAEGERVEVIANISDITSAELAARQGAEGVGLLRTEFLYLNEARPPTEDRQVEVYRAIFAKFDQRPVIVRTLDIGADKPPAFIDFPPEANPFLGWRGIRVCFDHPLLFRTQLRAILRAAHGYDVRLLFPMVNDAGDLRQIRTLLAEVRAELETDHISYAADVPLGIMVETPAAVMLADSLATEADFFSIGTNDLTQYALAVDRMNEGVAHLYQPLHPAVLRLIRHTIEAAHRAGIGVGLCGELAGMPRAIPLLLGMGLDSFSMTASAIPEAKWLIRQLRRSELRGLAGEVLAMRTAAEVELRVRESLDLYYADSDAV
jgi:phosphoenolpyruvate-protein phosphotransferase (PTS system enzyme I)